MGKNEYFLESVNCSILELKFDVSQIEKTNSNLKKKCKFIIKK